MSLAQLKSKEKFRKYRTIRLFKTLFNDNLRKEPYSHKFGVTCWKYTSLDWSKKKHLINSDAYSNRLLELYLEILLLK